MILILALGHVLANTRAVRRLLVAVASLVRSAQMAYVGLTVFASLAALISWGLGLVVPAVLSRIIANNCRERGIKVHFPLLVACAYCGSLVSMQGLSASIPLVLNTPNHFLEAEIGLIGLDQTIFSWWSISIVVAIMIILPQVMRRLAPHDEPRRRNTITGRQRASSGYWHDNEFCCYTVAEDGKRALDYSVTGISWWRLRGPLLPRRRRITTRYPQHDFRGPRPGIRRFSEALH